MSRSATNRQMLSLILLVTVLPCFVYGGQSGPSRAELRHRANILERRSELLKDLQFELRKLSDQCHEQGLPQAAADITQLALDLTTDGPRTPPPRHVTLPVSPKLPEQERLWRMRVRKLREDRAGELYTLARRALSAGLPSVAYQLVEDVLRLNPDQANARSILGQQLFNDPLRDDDGTYAGEWVSAYEAERRGGSQPHVLHETFGWIPRTHVVRYEEGQRLWKGSWISADKEREYRRDFRNAWEIESEHFLVKTNVGLEEGVVLSRQLEVFNEWLRQNMAAFFETPQELQSRFKKAHVRRRRRARRAAPMEVFYYATRDEYQRKTRRMVPPGIETNGLYWQPDSRSYFFRNEQRAGLDTLFHEATHQILDIPTRPARRLAARAVNRTRPPEWVLGGRSGFWLIEGLACYFESFEVRDGVVTVGRPDHIRFVAAQHRLLRDNFYIPLEMFCRLGKDEFQHHPNVRQLYSQASGLAHFLMHYDDGRYRDDLVRLLAALYRPDARKPLDQPDLSRITGVPFAVLDRQYREHMENLALQIELLPPGESENAEVDPPQPAETRAFRRPAFNRVSRPGFPRGQ